MVKKVLCLDFPNHISISQNQSWLELLQKKLKHMKWSFMPDFIWTWGKNFCVFTQSIGRKSWFFIWNGILCLDFSIMSRFPWFLNWFPYVSRKSWFSNPCKWYMGKNFMSRIPWFLNYKTRQVKNIYASISKMCLVWNVVIFIEKFTYLLPLKVIAISHDC